VDIPRHTWMDFIRSDTSIRLNALGAVEQQ